MRLGPGIDDVIQKPKSTQLWRHPRKPQIQYFPIFLYQNYKTSHIFREFEQLSSSLLWSQVMAEQRLAHYGQMQGLKGSKVSPARSFILIKCSRIEKSIIHL